MIPDHVIERVRESVDFCGLVSGYVTLKKSGPQHLTSCLWHDDSRPSCRIYKSHYHCYTCGAHGDVFSFLQRIEGISFSEALTRLAYRAGVSLDEKPVSRKAMAYATQEVAMCRWWLARRRERQMAAIYRNMDGDEEYLEALGDPLRWMESLSVPQQLAEFRHRVTERDQREWREHVATEREFAEAWMGLTASAHSPEAGE